MLPLRRWWTQRVRSAAARRPVSVRLRLEGLEERQLLANTSVAGAISAAWSGAVAVIRPDHSVWEYSKQFGWFPITDANFATSISAVHENFSNTDIVFALTQPGLLYEYNPTSGWRLLGGYFQSISAGLDVTGRADVFALTVSQNLYQFSQFGAKLLGSFIQSFAGGADDTVFAVLINNAAWEHSGPNGWTPVTDPGFAQTITVGTDFAGRQVVYINSTNNFLYEGRPGVGWVLMGGAAQFITAGTDRNGLTQVFSLTPAVAFGDSALYRFNDTSGAAFLGWNVAAASAADQDVVYTIMADQSVWQHANGAWSQLSGPGFAL